MKTPGMPSQKLGVAIVALPNSRLLVVLPLLWVWLALTACGGTDGPRTPNFAITPTQAPGVSAVEAVEAVKAFWQENNEQQFRRIRRGELDEVAWSSYRLCESINPLSSQTALCGKYQNRQEARGGFLTASTDLVDGALWNAIWEPATLSWQVVAQDKAFSWSFRLFEATGDVDILTRE